jgi:hypothetical protein
VGEGGLCSQLSGANADWPKANMTLFSTCSHWLRLDMEYSVPREMEKAAKGSWKLFLHSQVDMRAFS